MVDQPAQPRATVTVDCDALVQVLNALNGHSHEIRELQVTRGLHSLGGQYANPIETLLAEVRPQLEAMKQAGG